MSGLVKVAILIVFGLKTTQVKTDKNTIFQKMCRTICKEDGRCTTAYFDEIYSCCEASSKVSKELTTFPEASQNRSLREVSRGATPTEGFLMTASTGMFFVGPAFRKTKLKVRGLKGSFPQMVFSYDKQQIYTLSQKHGHVKVGTFTSSVIKFHTYRFITYLDKKISFEMAVDKRNNMLAVSVQDLRHTKVIIIKSQKQKLIYAKAFSVDKRNRWVFYTGHKGRLFSTNYWGQHKLIYRHVHLESSFGNPLLQIKGENIFSYTCKDGQLVKQSFQISYQKQHVETLPLHHLICQDISYIINFNERMICLPYTGGLVILENHAEEIIWLLMEIYDVVPISQ